jgi:hypothetical protein
VGAAALQILAPWLSDGAAILSVVSDALDASGNRCSFDIGRFAQAHALSNHRSGGKKTLNAERLVQPFAMQENALLPKTLPIFGLHDLSIVRSDTLQEISADASHIPPPFHIQLAQDIANMKLCGPFRDSQ